MWGRASIAPVSSSQLRALFILEHHEGINLRTLADALGSTPPATSRMCDRLRAVGFLTRSASPNSRRELQLSLSSRGHTFLRDLRIRREQELEAVIAHMPPSQREALLRGLEGFCGTASSLLDADADHSAGADTRTA
ncbi:MarR family transcriptional regulator [Streptomyces sp. ICBB 8177]|nr:MarR family transcriptional regulator [Streptomyces sp. ICBB 8177]